MGVFPHILKNKVSSKSSPDKICCGRFLQVGMFLFYTLSCGNRSHCNMTCGGLFDGNHIAMKTGRTGENPLTLLKALQESLITEKLKKGALLRWFMALYEEEVVQEETFLKWKEEVDARYEGKGEALIQLNKWLTWLEQAEEEDSDEEDDEI